MKITTKYLNKTRVELTIILTGTDLEPSRVKAIVALASEAKLPGFRKGKAPASIVERHLDPNKLSEQTLELAVRRAIPMAFDKESLRAVSMPEVKVTKYIPGEAAEFTAEAEILPAVKLGNFKHLKAKLKVPKITDDDVRAALDNVAKSFAKKSVVKRKAKVGDEVIIDFTGKKDGVAFDGGRAKDFKLILGDGQLIPGFEDGVVGHASGDAFELELSFPENYHNRDLAGAKTTFDILLKQVNAVELPKIDDGLAQKCGPFKTLGDLKKDIETNLAEQARHQAMEKYKDDLVAEVVKGSVVEAPEVMIKDQLRQTNDKELAEKRVKAALVLQELAKQLGIAADDAEAERKLGELKAHYQSNPEALKALADSRAVADIKNRLTIEKTLDKLVEINK
jgi:trigger factor